MAESSLNLIPSHQLGLIMPNAVADATYHQFYGIAPEHVSLVGTPLGLPSFTAEAVESALEKFWPALDFLVAREVQRISFGGVPLSAYMTRSRVLAMIEEAAKRTKIPFSLDFEEAIEAFKALKLKNIAITAKWHPDLMVKVAEYVREAGLSVAGIHATSYSAKEVLALHPKDGAAIALELGREAFKKFPNADGVMLAGGTWFFMESVPVLEREFGRPVVSNLASTFWAAFREFGCRPRKKNLGALFDAL